jgi:hypothetical protein
MDGTQGISCLNDDVLHDVFAWAEITMPITPKPGQYQYTTPRAHVFVCDLGWVRLSHVCRRWRAVSLAMTGQWARNVCAIPDAYKCFIDRSQEHPISINMSATGRNRDFESFILAPNLLRRAGSIVCDQSGDHDWSFILQNCYLPHLRVLDIRGSPHQVIRTIQVNAPYLTSLSLMSLRPELTCFVATLRTLNLDSRSTPEARWELLSTLSRTPQLEKLDVSLVWHPDAREDIWNPPRHLWDWSFFTGGIVELPALRQINLQIDETSGIVEFLCRIRARADASIAIRCHDRSDADRLCTLRDILRLYRHLTDANALRFLAGNLVAPHNMWHSDIAEFALFYSAGPPTIPAPLDGNPAPLDGISLQFHYTNMSVLTDVFQQLCRDVDTARIEHIDFDASLLLREGDTITAFFSAYVATKSVHVGGFFHPGPLRRLLPPTAAGVVLFPALRQLLLSMHKDWAHGEDRFKEWWEELNNALAWRAQNSMPIDRLVLLGMWKPKHGLVGTSVVDEAGIRVARGLVGTLADEREIVLYPPDPTTWG